MVGSFNNNPSTIILSCDSPTNVSDEMDLINFCNELSSFVSSIPKHNLQTISADMNAQIGKDKKTDSAYTTRQAKMGNTEQISHMKTD